MTEPKDGDFASYLNQLARQPDALKPQPTSNASHSDQTPDELESDEEIPEFLLDEQQKLSKELMRQAAELHAVEPLSDEELERQALQAGGSDNDSTTPE